MSYNSRCSCVRSDQCHAHIPRSCICSLETVRLDHEAERLCWCRTSNAGTDVHGPTEPVPQHPSNTSRDAAVLTDLTGDAIDLEKYTRLRRGSIEMLVDKERYK